MNQTQHPKVSVSLAHEDDFFWGAVKVSPSKCEIRSNGKSHSLQPRVMQVLVLLHSLEGGVATKDELIQHCWGGAAVTDDVITRCIFQLRSLAKELSGSPFSIKTVPKVGYALIVADTALQERPNENIGQPAKGSTLPRIGLWQTAAVATLSLVLVLAWNQFGNEQEWMIKNVRPLSTAPDLQSHPAVSPDDRFVIYSSARGTQNNDLWMRPFAGGEVTRLTTHPDFDHQVSFSPNGDRIAFVRSQRGASNVPCRIIVKDLLEGSERIVGRCKIASFSVSTPAWSLDGQSLIISEGISAQKDATVRLSRLDLASGERTPLTEPEAGIRGDLDPLLSPDGQKLLFRRATTFRSGRHYLMDLADRSLVPLTEEGQFRSAVWAPDGSQILMVSSDESDGLSVFSADGELLQQRSSGLLNQTLRIARGGQLLAAETSTFRSVVISRKGGREREIAAVLGLHQKPAAAPDGRLAFVTQARSNTGNAILWVTDAGGEPRRLAELPQVNALSWSKDGTKLGYASSDGTHLGVYDTTAEEIVTLPWDGGPIASVAWAPNDEAILFAAEKQGKWRLWRVSSQLKGQPQSWSDAGWWVVKTNNTGIYAARNDEAGIWRMSPDGKGSELIEASYTSGQGLGRTPEARNGFAVTNDRLFFHRFAEDSKTPGLIMSKPILPNSPAKLEAELAYPFAEFDVGSDGQLVFVRRLHTFQILLMDLIKSEG